MEALFLLVGVASRVSTDELLSLSVTVIYVDIKDSEVPTAVPPDVKPDLDPSSF